MNASTPRRADLLHIDLIYTLWLLHAILKMFWKSILRQILLSSLISLVITSGIYYLFSKLNVLVYIMRWVNNGRGVYEWAVGLSLIILVIYIVVHPLKFTTFKSSYWTTFDKILLGFVFAAMHLYIDRRILPNYYLISYLHFSLLTLTLVIVIQRIYYVFNSTPTKDKQGKEAKFLIPDIPIENTSDERFSRSSFRNKILLTLRETKKINGSFVMAITGSWGSGKSSMMNLCKHELKKDNECVVITFIPWQISTGDGKSFDPLLNKFFQTLERSLPKEDFTPQTKTQLRKYYKLLSPLLKNSYIDFGQLFESDDDLQSTKEKLEKTLAETRKRFFIFLDDIDRLAQAEIEYVFKIIRLCADFKTVTYILCYDSLILEQLLNNSQGFGRYYLEKVIQVEHQIPLINVEDFYTYLCESVKECNSYIYRNIHHPFSYKVSDNMNAHLDEALDSLNNYFCEKIYKVRLEIRDICSTPRQLKKILNNYAAFQLENMDLNPTSVFILELIKDVYPKLYNKIYEVYTITISDPDSGTRLNTYIKDNIKDDKEYKNIVSLVTFFLGDENSLIPRLKEKPENMNDLPLFADVDIRYKANFHKYFPVHNQREIG